jgi:hypothetical protein
LNQSVSIIVDTIDLIGKEITINILNKNKIITKEEYGIVPFVQDTTSKVRNDGYAIFNVDFKGSEDEVTDNWSELIGENGKAQLCIFVNVVNEKDVVYCGQNPPDHEGEGKEDNKYWLDFKGKWFNLYNDGTVIVISGISTQLGEETHNGKQWPVYETKVYSNYSVNFPENVSI